MDFFLLLLRVIAVVVLEDEDGANKGMVLCHGFISDIYISEFFQTERGEEKEKEEKEKIRLHL